MTSNIAAAVGMRHMLPNERLTNHDSSLINYCCRQPIVGTGTCKVGANVTEDCPCEKNESASAQLVQQELCNRQAQSR